VGVGHGSHFISEPIRVDQLRQRSWDDCRKAPRKLWERLQGESSDEARCSDVSLCTYCRAQVVEVVAAFGTSPIAPPPALTRSVYTYLRWLCTIKNENSQVQRETAQTSSLT